MYERVSTAKPEIHTVTLGTATSYNIKTLYPNLWDKVTIDNFDYTIAGGTGSKVSKEQSSNILRALYTAPSFSYNTSTGVLTCGNGTAKSEGFWSGDGTSSGLANYTTTTTCYMVYVE